MLRSWEKNQLQQEDCCQHPQHLLSRHHQEQLIRLAHSTNTPASLNSSYHADATNRTNHHHQYFEPHHDMQLPRPEKNPEREFFLHEAGKNDSTTEENPAFDSTSGIRTSNNTPENQHHRNNLYDKSLLPLLPNDVITVEKSGGPTDAGSFSTRTMPLQHHQISQCSVSSSSPAHNFLPPSGTTTNLPLTTTFEELSSCFISMSNYTSRRFELARKQSDVSREGLKKFEDDRKRLLEFHRKNKLLMEGDKQLLLQSFWKKEQETTTASSTMKKKRRRSSSTTSSRSRRRRKRKISYSHVTAISPSRNNTKNGGLCESLWPLL